MTTPKNAHYIPVDEWTYKQWVSWRYENGFGSSDMGRLLDLPEAYGSSMELYLEYIGEKEQFKGNLNSKAGHYFEPSIRDRYQYWDFNNPNAEAMYDNHKNGKKFRDVIKYEAYCKHNEQPRFCSLDGEVVEEYQLDYKALLECKNTTKMLQRKYTEKYSPSFKAQVQNSLALTGFPVAHICMALDGYDFEVVEVEPEKEWIELIEYKALDLWRRVLEARRIKLEYGVESYYAYNEAFFYDKPKQLEGVLLLQSIEPEIDYSIADLSFIKDMIIPNDDAVCMQATREQILLLQQFAHWSEQKKESSDMQENLKMQIIKTMGKSVNGIQVGEWQVTHKMTKRGTRFYFPEKLKDCLKSGVGVDELLGKVDG